MIENTRHYPLVSIITVVYNSVDFIENTIKSILHEEYPNLEYVIIDGASSDGTYKILKNYEEYIDILISEKDKGLYYAMNKAIRKSTGDYLWFINAGDEVYSPNNLTTIFSDLSQTTPLPDIIYGETEIINEDREPLGMRRHTTPENLDWRTFRFGMKVCHQSVLVSRRIMEEYNTKYRYSADFEWFIRMLKKTDNIYNSHLILSKFMDGGLTKHNLKASLKERFSIMSKYYGFFPTVFNHIYLATRLGFYYIKNKRF